MTTMKTMFPEYCPLTESSSIELLRDCIFIFDTNILLNLYRYQQDTVNEFFSVCDKIADRLWMPYQVCQEFMKNRPYVIIEQHTLIEQYIKTIEKISKDTDLEFSKINQKLHSVVNIEAILQDIQNKFTNIKEMLSESKKVFDGSVHMSLLEDNIIARLEMLFKDKINKEPDDIDAKRKNVLERYKINTPPGYEDFKDKGEEESCGDCLIWFEILEKAKSDNRSVVFVSDDNKEDWVWKINGKRLWCRPELIKEFSNYTQGQIFYSYNMARFFEVSKQYIQASVKTSSIDDAKRVATEQDNSYQHFNFFEELIEIILSVFEDILSDTDRRKILKDIEKLEGDLSISDFINTRKLSKNIEDIVDFLLNHPFRNRISDELITNFNVSISMLIQKYNQLAIASYTKTFNSNHFVINYNKYFPFKLK